MKEELKNARGKDKEKAENKLARAEEQLKKLKIQRTDRVSAKFLAIGRFEVDFEGFVRIVVTAVMTI